MRLPLSIRQWIKRLIIWGIALFLAVFGFIQYQRAEKAQDRADFFEDKYYDCLNIKDGR